MEPTKIIVSFGNKQYTVLKNSEDIKKNFDNELKKIFSAIVANGTYVNEENINMREFLNNKAVLYEYPVKLSSISSINRDYDEGNKNVRQIGEFNKIILQPSNLGDGSLNCIFIDEQSNLMKKIKISNNSRNISDWISSVQNEALLKIYNTTEYDASKKYFSHLNFLPAFNKSETYFNQNIIMKNPFIVNNEIDENKVEEYINYFFENPSAKWNFKKQNGVTVYADGEKSIKFYDAGVLEYTNSKTFNKNTYINFEGSYQIARAFIEKDNKYMAPNLYLVNAEKNADNEWEFNFEFKLDDYRYIMSNEVANEIGIKYPIEVVVKNNNVYSYKRLIRELQFVPSFEKIQLITYNEALDEILNTRKANETILIKDMFLSYYSDNIEENPKLTWIIETSNKVYTIYAIKS